MKDNFIYWYYYMNFIKPSGDCLTINPDTYWYDFVTSLRKIHDKNANYHPIAFEQVIADLNPRLQQLLRQDEDLQLVKLEKHNVVCHDYEKNTFHLHQTHQKPF